jgi:hypothetical protein
VRELLPELEQEVRLGQVAASTAARKLLFQHDPIHFSAIK